MCSEKRIEQVLRTHPGVYEAAVVRDKSGAVSAFVLMKDDYLKDTLGFEAAESSTVGKWRKAYDLSQRTREAKEAPAGFNTVGWVSSYTRQPIPSEEMREWVDATVADILRFEPRKVYEIGCGTGLLLARIAAKCDSYIAGDFAPAVLDRLNDQLLTIPAIRDRVHVQERTADDFSGLMQDSVDTVILSSVVQYFPSAAYLTKVLERAVNIVKPGGRVYVGDVRSLPLYPAFSTSVELFRAADEMPVDDFRNLIQRRMGREPELLISPAYFLELKRRTAKIAEVEVRPLRGHAVNEMTGYRYQAILHIGSERDVLPTVAFGDWSERRWTGDDIREALHADPNGVLGIRSIPNSRVERDVSAAHLIDVVASSSSVGDLRRRNSETLMAGLDPQDIFDLELDGLDFRVFLSWSASYRDGSYDACFIPRGLTQQQIPSISWPEPGACESVYLTNGSGRRKQRSELTLELRDHCLAHLEAEMAPAMISLVDSLPRERSGHYDAQALLTASRRHSWL